MYSHYQLNSISSKQSYKYKTQLLFLGFDSATIRMNRSILVALITTSWIIAATAKGTSFQTKEIQGCPDDEMYTQYPDYEDCKGLVQIVV